MKNNRKMIQVLGTSSHAGKTTVALALLRTLSNMGHAASPFKSVNMSLNSVSLEDGSEISRSVWLQARAARVVPRKEMNPFLLKPERNGGSQVIVLGESMGVMTHAEYSSFMQEEGPAIVKESLGALFEEFPIIVAEGAGSAAEINFAGKDLANSYISSLYGTPSLLVGNIDRGGVFASLYGTSTLMEHPETLRWMIINGMRGNASLLEPAIRRIEDLTGKEIIGVLPHSDDLKLPGEDSLDYDHHNGSGRIAVVKYPFMENHSDVDPLVLGRIPFTYATSASELDGADVIILPGSKDVYSDLEFIRGKGIDKAVASAAANGKVILGICGGYQMLGRTITEGGGRAEGLGILDCTTEYSSVKTVSPVHGSISGYLSQDGGEINGYEIHRGTVRSHEKKHAFDTAMGKEGSVSDSGRIIGTNIHGVLESGEFLEKVLKIETEGSAYEALVEKNLDLAAEIFSSNARIDRIMEYIETGKQQS